MRDGGKALWFRAMLKSFGVPVEGTTRVELMRGQERAHSLDAEVHAGVVEGELPLPDGNEVLTINFVSGEKSASLPIRGGKAAE